MLRRTLAAASLLLAIASCATIPTDTPCDLHDEGFKPAIRASRVVLVIFENEDSNVTLKTDYFLELSKKGAYFPNYYAAAHPSQPNYIALVSGSIRDVRGDSLNRLERYHIGQSLPASPRSSSWAVYAEDYQPSCAYGANETSGNYARRHVPFLSFADVQDDKDGICRDHIKGFPEDFAAAAKQADFPRFALVVPNLIHDGHNASADCEHGNQLECAGSWLKQHFDGLVNDPAFMRDTMLIVTFDESGEPFPYDKGLPNKVYLAVLGGDVKPAVIDGIYNHYDLLRTMQAVLDVKPVAATNRRECGHVIREIWKQ